jgi:hypothetical protein
MRVFADHLHGDPDQGPQRRQCQPNQQQRWQIAHRLATRARTSGVISDAGVVHLRARQGTVRGAVRVIRERPKTWASDFFIWLDRNCETRWYSWWAEEAQWGTLPRAFFLNVDSYCGREMCANSTIHKQIFTVVENLKFLQFDLFIFVMFTYLCMLKFT